MMIKVKMMMTMKVKMTMKMKSMSEVVRVAGDPGDFELLLQTSDHYNFVRAGDDDHDGDLYDCTHDNKMMTMTVKGENFLRFGFVF